MIGGGEAKERKVGETKVAKSNRFGIEIELRRLSLKKKP